MNFCHECGVNLKENAGALFCPSCGVKLEPLEEETQPTSPKRKDKLKQFEDGRDSYGILYTNIDELSETFNSKKEEVMKVISDYIEKLKLSGHQYVLLDVANNDYNNLSSNDSWETHVELLRSFYNDCEITPEYLFIVGGHNIIPMAMIDNRARCYEKDTDIDTDMSYSYLLSDDFESLLWDGSIFRDDVKLNVGRLPFSSNSEFYDLQNYLLRMYKNYSSGIQINNCFGMTALSWQKASQKIIKDASAQKSLHTSPEIDINSIDRIYNDTAELYYFNLHGSNAPGSPEFFGDKSRAIAPNHISRAGSDNFLMTEACYGAKFIDYDKESSMLLSALGNRTLCFVGSSRVAFGASTENISSADIIAKSYIDGLFDGITCGKSLTKARIDVFDACTDDHYDHGVTSAVEFNLFGDPVLFVSGSGKSFLKKNSNSLKNKNLKSKSLNKIRPEIKELYSFNGQKGVLDEVRNLVDNEIFKIRDIINTYLYENFNVEPRDLQKIISIKSKFGEETYNYVYQKKNGDLFNIYAVFTDKHGKIKSILTSK